MPELLSLDQIRQKIAEQYPTVMSIMNKPGVWDALVEAIQGGWGPSSDRFKVRMQQTEWYRQTPATERDWYIHSAIDPASAQQEIGEVSQRINNLRNRTGIELPPEVLTDITNRAAANKWSDSELRNNYVYAARGIHTGPSTGEGATDFNTVKTLASDYGVPISDQTAFLWADRLTAGSVDQNAVKGYMIEQAKSMYPSLAGAIDAGFTVRAYADPYAQVAARELNINPDDFQLSDPKWSAALSQVDPKTGQKMAMSLDQWQTQLRTDPKYGYDQTLGAQSQAASLTTALAQKFGAIG